MNNKYISFENKILILGFGSVGQCLLPLVLRHLDIDPKNIIVLEAADNTERFLEKYAAFGIGYVVQSIDIYNMAAVLEKYLDPGDYLIDVSTDIAAIDIIDWCQTKGVLYLNTSLEDWPEENQNENYPHHIRTLYNAHQNLREAAAKWKPNGATTVITHGANPGIVSHFVKEALLDISEATLGSPVKVPENKEEWAKLAQSTGTKVIHISERDTQVSHCPKMKDQFVNTWSAVGFYAEGIAPAEMGWGTHETWKPDNMFEHEKGPRNSTYMKQPGAATIVRSWVPEGGDINGYVIQHSEAVTLSEYFTVTEDDKAVYRPTVHYAYMPSDAAIASMYELQMNEWKLQSKLRIMGDDITSGVDELGVLLMGHDLNAWWYGSVLDINVTRVLMDSQDYNATSLQVAASILAAMVWTINYPNEGFCEVEDLPHRYILEIARPYLGRMISKQSGWRPVDGRSPLYEEEMDLDNIWSFKNFLI